MTDERIPTVLIVDDEPRILSALQRTLRREGYDIIAAETPEEALRLLEGQCVDVVLTDQKMPGMSGLQLLGRVAQRRPETVRMLITGWTEMLPDEEIRAAGVRAIIPKPWEDSALKRTLRLATHAMT